MDLSRRWTSLPRVLARVLAVVACLLLATQSVSAECFGETDPWPSFRLAAPTAQRIVAGRVLPPDVETGGYLAAFRLSVIDVVRGPRPANGVLEVVGFRSGLPAEVCADSDALLLPGDVVVLAFDSVAPDGVTRINTLAYLERAGDSILTDVEDVTPAELEAFALPPDEPATLLPLGVLAAAGLLTIVGLGAWTFRRARGGQRT